jgi:hypothetical protein
MLGTNDHSMTGTLCGEAKIAIGTRLRPTAAFDHRIGLPIGRKLKVATMPTIPASDRKLGSSQ